MAKKQKRTRQKKDPAKVKSERIAFKVTPAMFKYIKDQAAKDNRTVSGYMVNVFDRLMKGQYIIR